MMRSFCFAVCGTICLLSLMACSGGNTTQSEPPLALKLSESASLTLTCSNCHALPSEGMRDISALSIAEIEASLLAYKTDENGTTVMHRLLRGYSEDDIQSIAKSLGTTND